LPDFSQGGLYSRAVPCGLGEDCEDHTLLPFTIEQTEITQGIDLCDWYAGPFNVPYPPGMERTEVTGVISGSLSHRMEVRSSRMWYLQSSDWVLVLALAQLDDPLLNY
jgi:hypothetical protein